MIFSKWKFWVYVASVSLIAGVVPEHALAFLFGCSMGWIAMDHKHWFD